MLSAQRWCYVLICNQALVVLEQMQRPGRKFSDRIQHFLPLSALSLCDSPALGNREGGREAEAPVGKLASWR